MEINMPVSKKYDFVLSSVAMYICMLFLSGVHAASNFVCRVQRLITSPSFGHCKSSSTLLHCLSVVLAINMSVLGKYSVAQSVWT